MGKVIDLAGYRTLKKRSYLKKYDAHIQKFVSHFIYRNVRCSFESMSHSYIVAKQREHAVAWDYCDFRDTLREAMEEVFGQQIWEECNRHYWFDARYLSRDEIIERFVSQMVLGPDVSALR